jgi:predicted dinucleotide-binding enzyme
MKIGIIGSGMVAQQLGLGFIKSGHDVKIGTRNPDKLKDWQNQAGVKASVSSFSDAARFGDFIVLATLWANDATKNAIEMAGKGNFGGKTVMDVTNPLLFDVQGQPPRPAIGYPESGGALIQSWIPEAKVVKAFNIVTAYYMANPKLEEGTPDMFIAGDHSDAKETVRKIAAGWGWNSVIDIGGIEQSYLLEAMALVWIRFGFLNNHWKHAFKLLRK